MSSKIVRSCLAAAALVVAAAGSAAAAQYHPVFPLKQSTNHRYMVDQNDVPFMIVGDSPQALIGNLSVSQAKAFLDNRQSYGINALWINLLCASYTACHSDGSTGDNIKPFTTEGDISTPNPAYFDRAAKMIELAAARHMVVFLDPIETGSWLGILNANGPAKGFAFGQYLGNRFKNYPNIVWMSGNDFQQWQDPNLDAVVRSVAQGLQSADPDHPQTVELSYYVSASSDDKPWRKIIDLDAVYTYRPSYAKALETYKRNLVPTFMVEANYEFEQNGGTDGGSLPNLRKQEYWSALSGTTGQLYGSQFSWRLDGDWPHNLDTTGIRELSYMKKLFAARRWYDLVPDRAHTVLTHGYGHYSDTDSINTDNYATAGRTPDGSLVMAYIPTLRNVKIDMSQLSGPVTAQWYDPTNATLSKIGGHLANTGERTFTPPGPNASGDGDWILLLEVK